MGVESTRPSRSRFPRRVALKVLPFAAAWTQHTLGVQNEARAAASLDHPHIVHVIPWVVSGAVTITPCSTSRGRRWRRVIRPVGSGRDRGPAAGGRDRGRGSGAGGEGDGANG